MCYVKMIKINKYKNRDEKCHGELISRISPFPQSERVEHRRKAIIILLLITPKNIQNVMYIKKKNKQKIIKTQKHRTKKTYKYIATMTNNHVRIHAG